MKKLCSCGISPVLFLLLTLLLSFSSLQAEEVIKEKPDYENIIRVVPDNSGSQQVVIDLSRRLFSLLKNEAEYFQANRDQIQPRLEAAIGEMIDFQRIAARVMGKYYLRASKQQKLDLLEVFKRGLMHTYVNGLLDEDIEILVAKLHVKILPAKLSGRKKNKARVETAFGVGETIYTVVYSLYMHRKTQKWLIENLEVEGINIGITLRNQFNLLMDENNGDINKVISLWSGHSAEVDEDRKL